MPDPTAISTPQDASDDLTPLGRITAIAAAGGISGCGVLWVAEPDRIESGVMVVVGMVLAAAVAVASLALPWSRLSRGWVAFPVLSGAALTALATWNTGGTDSPFALFYLYVATLAAYFASRRQTLYTCGAVAVCAGLPVVYDHAATLTDRVFVWVLVSAMATALALVLQRQRERVRRATAQAHALALQDPLTGMANRRGFELRAGAELARARRHGLRFTVLYIDLDGFKRVNDVAGHAAGDRLLRRVALAVGVAVRGEDFVARHGGDEFAILLPGAAEPEARRVGARVVAAVERTAADDGRLAGLSASVGGATYPDDGATVTELLEAADAELLRVKSLRADRGQREAHGYAIPTAPVVPDSDVFARLGPGPGEAARAPGGFAPGPVLPVAAAVTAAACAAWALVPALGAGEGARRALLGLLTLGVVAAAMAAARRAGGAERAGWALVAAAAPVAWLPFLGAAFGAGAGLGVLLIGSVAWPPDRRGLLDLADVFTVLAAYALVFVVPPLASLAQDARLTWALVPGAAFAATAGVTCLLVVATRTSARSRPDLWLVAAGFALAGASAVPLAATAAGPHDLAGEWWAGTFVLAACLVATGAVLRARHGAAVGPPGAPRPLAGIVVGNVLIAGLLISLVAAGEQIPVRVIPLLLVTLVLRHLRSRLVARENARLQEAARQSERDLSAQYRASLMALGAALEARDGYTGGHGEHTVTLARRVAERLGLPPATVAEAETVALLHDVGKIGMPDEILRKPGPLDEREMGIVRQHPLIGERILRQVPGLDGVARAVRHEHERWDGTGYPDGLSGEAIPLSSRITMACDAFDAMTSDRPYRPAIPAAEAAGELRRGSGSQFDPAVVTALLDVLAETGPGAAAAGARLPAHQAAS